ncbi:MAG TPA: hypothetical protein VGK93_01365 [Candidatus Eisenbacteria bacterium]|jgi:hypothetical protein
MRRAVGALVLLATLLPTPGWAQSRLVDAVAFIDYQRKPDFKIGTWVRYRVQSRSLQGYRDDYTITIVVAGEEVFWGDPGFWLETWVEGPDEPPQYTATLMSYSAFGDSMAALKPIWFTRKTIDAVDEEGHPEETVARRMANELKLRAANYEADRKMTANYRDTLGIDTTTVPAGHFRTLTVRQTRPVTETVDRGDSTIYYEHKEVRTFHYTDQVPLTSVARIDIDDVQQGKSWLIGKSTDRPLNLLERAQGALILVGYGTSGLAAQIIPKAYRHPIQRPAVRAPSRSTAPRPRAGKPG